MPEVLVAIFNVLVALALPLGVLVWLIAKRRRLVWPFLLGALTFMVSQMLLRLPLLDWLQGQAWFAGLALFQPVLYSLLLGLSAGLFEEVGRWVSMRFFLRGRQTLPAALAFGVGHGGLEAILFVGANYLALLVLGVAQPGLYPLPEAGLAVLAGLERLCAMTLHVGWSVMVMQAVRRKQPLWLALAVLLHGLADGLLGVLQLAGAGNWGIMLYLVLIALAMLAYTIVVCKKEASHEKT